MDNNIKSIAVDTGTEPCNVDVGLLHETLLKLPADKYIALYRRMQKTMETGGAKRDTRQGTHDCMSA